MESNYGKITCKIDDKGRIIIPPKFYLPEGEDVLFVNKSDNNYYYMYLLKVMDDIINRLFEKKYSAQNEEQFKLIENEIKLLLNSIEMKSKITKQRRVVIPNALRSNEKVLLMGNYDSVLLFPNIEVYDDYCRSLYKK